LSFGTVVKGSKYEHALPSGGFKALNGRWNRRGFVVAEPPTTAGECGILLDRVDLSDTSKLPIAVPNLHSTAEGVLSEVTPMFADLEGWAARNIFLLPLTSLIIVLMITLRLSIGSDGVRRHRTGTYDLTGA
jgi:hypothetical protein